MELLKLLDGLALTLDYQADGMLELLLKYKQLLLTNKTSVFQSSHFTYIPRFTMEHIDRAIELMRKYRSLLIPRLPYPQNFIDDEVNTCAVYCKDKFNANRQAHIEFMNHILE